MKYENFKKLSIQQFHQTVDEYGVVVNAQVVLHIVQVLNMLAKVNGFGHRVQFVNVREGTKAFMIDGTCRDESFELTE